MVERQLEVLKVKDRISNVGPERDEPLAARVRAAPADEEHPRGARRGRRRRRDRAAARAHRARRAAARGREGRAQAARRGSRGMQPQSAEYQVTRTYVEWLADLPWNRTTPDRIDVREVRRCLDEDHFGLERVKKRIVEYCGDPPAAQRQEGADPALRRSARRRQDLARPLDRARHGPALRAHLARRRARRGRDPRPPPHLRRRAPGPHHPGAEEGRLPRTRCSCSTRSTRWASTCAAIPPRRCSRCSIPSRTTTFVDHYIDLPFDLSRGHVPRDRQLRLANPRGAQGPHGAHRGARLHAHAKSARSPSSS